VVEGQRAIREFRVSPAAIQSPEGQFQPRGWVRYLVLTVGLVLLTAAVVLPVLLRAEIKRTHGLQPLIDLSLSIGLPMMTGLLLLWLVWGPPPGPPFGF
jgi:hypothetical protein